MVIGKSEKIFKLVTISTLFFIILFFISVIISMVFYLDSYTFISTLLSKEIIFAIKLSMVTATIATLISLIIGVPSAYALSRTEFIGKNIIDALLDLPIVLSPIALGAALLIFFSIDKMPLGDYFVFEVSGIIVAQFTIVSALTIRLMKSTFDSIDPNYENVARTLGYSKSQAFFKVTLPLSKNGLIASSILAWARAIGEFGATVTLAGATKMKTETLPIAIFLSLQSAEVEKAISVIFILIFLALITLIIFRKIGGNWL
ncbi:MAG: ABC transporter permease [Methanosarcinales archaeon]